MAAISVSRLQKLTLSLLRYCLLLFFLLLHHDSADSCYTHCLSDPELPLMWYCVCISHSCSCNNMFYHATLLKYVFFILLLALCKMYSLISVKNKAASVDLTYVDNWSNDMARNMSFCLWSREQFSRSTSHLAGFAPEDPMGSAVLKLVQSGHAGAWLTFDATHVISWGSRHKPNAEKLLQFHVAVSTRLTLASRAAVFIIVGPGLPVPLLISNVFFFFVFLKAEVNNSGGHILGVIFLSLEPSTTAATPQL